MTKISRLLLVMLLSLLMGGSAYAAGNDSNTVLLIQSDNTDGDTTFTDTSVGGTTHSIGVSGGVHHETDQAQFGASSIYFDGSGDYLSIPDSDDWYFGSGDFTIDFWVYYTDSESTHRIFIAQSNIDVVNGSFYLLSYNGIVYLNINRLSDGLGNASGGGLGLYSTESLVLNQWNHVAAVRHGSDICLFVNGHLENRATYSDSLYNSTMSLILGKILNRTYDFSGYLDNVRISKGIARTTDPNDPMYLTIDTDEDGINDSFSVPTTPYSTEPLSVSISTDVSSGSLPLEVNFTPNATGGTWPYTYSWDFDGDSVEDSTDQNPSYTYNSSGSYTATVTVTDSNSSTATDTITINVNQTLSIDSYSASPSTGFTPLDVAFSITPAGGIEPYTYSWDFDDDGVEDSTDQNPSYTYTSAYSGNAVITITDYYSNTVSQSIALSITELTSADCYATYDFINNEFIVPCFEFDGVLYRIDMTLQAGDPYAFEVNTILAK